MEILSRNTNTLAPRVYPLLDSIGIKDASRNGDVIRFPDPVTICITHPYERVNFCPVRNANPFFHFMEAMAMLAQCNSVKFLSHFAKNIAAYSDDGQTFNAFYGTRARGEMNGTEHDQLQAAISELMIRPDSRQAVVMLWDKEDQLRVTKDKACNLMMLFSIEPDMSVRMTTFNRSNDAIWGGVTGANVVHFSYFHEYVASALGLAMGAWWHTSNNLHVYESNPQWQQLKGIRDGADPYTYRDMTRPLLFAPHERDWFDYELQDFMDTMIDTIDAVSQGHYNTISAANPSYYVNTVVRPMFNAWQCHKRQDSQSALHHASAIADEAWRLSCTQWLERRNHNKSLS